MADVDTGGLPAALTVPVAISVRNADLNINNIGQAHRLDETGLVAVLPVKVAAGVVLFTNFDLRSLNTTARGLIKVKSQRSLSNNAGYETLADFIELNDDNKKKIDRLLGRIVDEPPPLRPGTFGISSHTGHGQPFFPGGMAAADYAAAQMAGRRQYFEPAPLRPVAKPTRSTKFWGSLGVTAYVAAFLIVVAMFPVGRSYEVMAWSKVAYAAERTWFWGTHIGDVKLYNNK